MHGARVPGRYRLGQAHCAVRQWLAHTTARWSEARHYPCRHFAFLSSPISSFCQSADRPHERFSNGAFYALAADRLPAGTLETNGQRGGFQQRAVGNKRPTLKGSSWPTCPCCPSAGLRQVGSFTRRSSHLDSPPPSSEACSPSIPVFLNGRDAHSPVAASSGPGAIRSASCCCQHPARCFDVLDIQSQ